MSFLSWWSHFGQELHAEQNITPKQLAEAAYNAAKLDIDLQGEWGDGYAEGYQRGVKDQIALSNIAELGQQIQPEYYKDEH